jgi:hypothetical protein
MTRCPGTADVPVRIQVLLPSQMPSQIRKAIDSETVLSAAIFGMSGLAFAAANIILARTQSVRDYAIFTLVVAIVTMSAHLGLFGADGVVNRQEVRPDSRMFGRLFATVAPAAIMAGMLAVGYYDIGLPLAGLLSIAVVAQALIYFAAAHLRSRQEFRPSLLTFNSSSYVVLAVAVAVSVFGWQGALLPVSLFAGLLLTTASWSVFKTVSGKTSAAKGERYNWREATAFISITGSAQILVQMERLVTPKLLTLEDLATLGVVLAIVGPPFRLLQLSLGYVLLPKLRSAQDSLEKNALIFREIAVALSLLVPCWLLTWYLVPILDRLFFGDKYPLSGELILAVIVAGTAKALSGIGTASVAGVASARDLELTGIASWIGVAVSIAGAYAGAGFGLTGVVYGVSLGWFLRIVVAAVLVGKSLADATDKPAPAAAQAEESPL